MDRLFIFLTHAVDGSPIVALSASAIWGILSVILSPCHLSSIPLIVAFVSEQGNLTRRRAFAVSSLFALGILVTIALIGILTAGMGRMMGDVGKVGNYLVATVFLLVGLHLLGVIPMPWSGPGGTKMNRKGLLAAFVLGLIFGIAIGPCTFAYMAPMLVVSFRVASTSLVYAVGLLLSYGLGHCAVIVLAGTSAGTVQRYLNWNETSKGTVILKRVCGILVILGGVYMVHAVT